MSKYITECATDKSHTYLNQGNGCPLCRIAALEEGCRAFIADIDERDKRIAELEAEKAALKRNNSVQGGIHSELLKQIDTMQERIVALEAENAQLRAISITFGRNEQLDADNAKLKAAGKGILKIYEPIETSNAYPEWKALKDAVEND